MKDVCTFHQLLSSFVDGELDPEEHQNVQVHITMCRECRSQVEMHGELDSLVRGIVDIDPSDEFDRGLWKKIDRIEARKRRWKLTDILFKGVRPYLAAGAAMCLMVLAFTGSLYTTPGPGEIMIAENLELFQEFDIVDRLDLLENWETIMKLKEGS